MGMGCNQHSHGFVAANGEVRKPLSLFYSSSPRDETASKRGNCSTDLGNVRRCLPDLSSVPLPGQELANLLGISLMTAFAPQSRPTAWPLSVCNPNCSWIA